MNKKPVSYLQTDPAWKNIPYQAPGETRTIGTSGCGPTSAAMLISTITGKKVTPVDTCKWSIAHGYKAANQGTYYSYFTPQFKEYGIECKQLNWENLRGKPNDPRHDKYLSYLKEGYYLIALMKEGNWTSSGHFIVVWDVDDKIRINDPASTRDNRVNGDIRTFKNECAYYWLVDGRSVNKGDDDMDQATFMKMLENSQSTFDKMLASSLASMGKRAPGAWSKEARDYCTQNKIITGDAKGNLNWGELITKEQAAILIYKAVKSK